MEESCWAFERHCECWVVVLDEKRADDTLFLEVHFDVSKYAFVRDVIFA